MRRRWFLAAIGGGTLSLAGCTTGSGPGEAGDGTPTVTDTDSVPPGDGTAESPAVPATCPTSQGLDVEWPEELDAVTVKSFVEAYEHVYYREIVVEYEPESQLDSYELSGTITTLTAVGDGWELSYSGSGGIYRPTLWLGARTATPPDGADVVSVSEVDDELLARLLTDAAETGTAQHHIDPPGEKVDQYVDLLASLSNDFEPLSGPGDSDALYVSVDGTAVELTAEADTFTGTTGGTRGTTSTNRSSGARATRTPPHGMETCSNVGCPTDSGQIPPSVAC
ncbi:hypothetical protein ACH9L7_16625 (plasmid) [Haloferax sp. S1W]|uniref:hypothetical protein n=1 Tax=Haloferax sp. S1W TaxID=3377110 RepID=UPI0037C9E363